MHSPFVSILIPAYNEENSIDALVTQILKLYPDAETLVIDDGSGDQTAERARQAGAWVICHGSNRGYGASLKTGLTQAKGEVAVFFDAEGEHDPHDIGRLLKAMENADMAVGARADPLRKAFNRVGKRILTRLAELLIQRSIPDLNAGLLAVTRETALEFISKLPDGFSLTTTLTLFMFRNGYRITYLPVRVRPPKSPSRVGMKDFFKTFFRIVKIAKSPCH